MAIQKASHEAKNQKLEGKFLCCVLKPKRHMKNFVLAKTKSLLAPTMSKGIFVAAWGSNMLESSVNLQLHSFRTF